MSLRISPPADARGLVVAALAVLGCRTEAKPKPVAAVEPAPALAAPCIADEVGNMRVSENPLRDDCADPACAEQCAAGDANACFNRARELEMDGADAEAAVLYERGCRLGDGFACLNHGAWIWKTETDAERLGCAGRLFTRVCDAGNHIGCAMRGRIMLGLARTDADFTEVRVYLEKTCARLPGFSCRVLALAYEQGAFGDHDAALIPPLLERACAGGDRESCGAPATASETFY